MHEDAPSITERAGCVKHGRLLVCYTARMQPIFWQGAGLTISTYAVCMVLGLIAGTLASLSEARRLQIRSALLLDAILAAVVAGVLAARLGYVLLNWAYYQDHIAEILRVWQGGLNWQAGLIGGSLGAWLIARRYSSPWRILDLIALGTALGVCFGWMGAYLSGTAFGKELFPGQPFFLLAVDAPDWYGLTNPRWPTQIMGAVWALCVFLALWLTRKKDWLAGTRYWLFVAVYSGGAFLLGFTRGDDIPRWDGWRADQLLDALLFAIALLALIRRWLSHRTQVSPHSRSHNQEDSATA